MNIDELKKCCDERIPVTIDRSYFFCDKPTYIISVKECEPLGGLVKVEGSDDRYEGYRIRIAK